MVSKFSEDKEIARRRSSVAGGKTRDKGQNRGGKAGKGAYEREMENREKDDKVGIAPGRLARAM